MQPSLAGVDLRLGRADQALRLLDGARRALLAEPHPIVSHFDADAREYVFRVEGKQPPLAWGLILSDAIHSLRASLDNMLWQLVLARGGKPGRHTQFCIFEFPTDRKRQPNAAKVALGASGVLLDDLALIEAYQPYHVRDHPGGEAEWRHLAQFEPLAMLEYLDNVDKHRYLHAGFAAATVEAAQWGQDYALPSLAVTSRWLVGVAHPQLFGMPVPMLTGEDTIERYEGTATSGLSWSITDDDPAEIARIRGVVLKPGVEPNVKMDPSTPLDISFSGAERPISIWDLRTIDSEVRSIVEYFRPIIAPDAPRSGEEWETPPFRRVS